MSEHVISPFDENSTAEDVISGIDLTGKRAIVTGGSSGIGTETLRALASAGAEVTFTTRNAQTGEKIAGEIRMSTGNEAVFSRVLDLNDWAGIDEFAKSWSEPLHILVNNAGIMALPSREIVNGYEAHFASNHLGHFRLTARLHQALKAADGARVVSLSSRGHLRSPVVFGDINFEHRPYDPMLAYGQSKTANILLAAGIAHYWQGDAITANAVHPGTIASTNLARHMDPDLLQRLMSAPIVRKTTIAEGAATSVFVATSPLLDGISGRYFEKCGEAETVHPEPGAPPLDHGVADYALDLENALRLWSLSETIAL